MNESEKFYGTLNGIISLIGWLFALFFFCMFIGMIIEFGSVIIAVAAIGGFVGYLFWWVFIKK